MKKWLAVAALLFAIPVSAHNMPMPGGPGNTYATTRTVSFNRNAGANGTVFISYSFTGSTQQPQTMCTQPGIQHQPRVTATLKAGNGQTFNQSSQGQDVGPCTNMNQTLAIAFDLAASDCDLTSLEDGNCTIQDAPIIFCTALGHGFGFLPGGTFQPIFANTTSQVQWSTKGINGDGVTFYDAHSYCPPGKTPPDNPDFPGPDVVFQGPNIHTAGDPIQQGYVRTQDFCWRWTFGTSLTGIPFACMNVPRFNYVSYIQMRATLAGEYCTSIDNGYTPSF